MAEKITGRIKARGNINGKISSRSNIKGTLGMPSDMIPDYNLIRNKPSIDNVTLVGNKNLSDFGDRPISNTDILAIVNRVFN